MNVMKYAGVTAAGSSSTSSTASATTGTTTSLRKKSSATAASASSLLVPAQEAGTPTMSNRGSMKYMDVVPALSLPPPVQKEHHDSVGRNGKSMSRLNGDSAASPITAASLSTNRTDKQIQQKHKQQHKQHHQPRPRFSSPTTTPIVVTRPLVSAIQNRDETRSQQWQQQLQQKLGLPNASFTPFAFLGMDHTATSSEDFHDDDEDESDTRLPSSSSSSRSSAAASSTPDFRRSHLLDATVGANLTTTLVSQSQKTLQLSSNLQMAIFTFLCDCLKTGILRPQLCQAFLQHVFTLFSTMATAPGSQLKHATRIRTPFSFFASQTGAPANQQTMTDTPTPCVQLDVLQIVGLPNQGQTCFLNSVLQALASLGPFLLYLDKVAQLNQQTAVQQQHQRQRQRQLSSHDANASGKEQSDNDLDSEDDDDDYSEYSYSDDEAWNDSSVDATKASTFQSPDSFSHQLLHLLQQINGHETKPATTASSSTLSLFTTPNLFRPFGSSQSKITPRTLLQRIGESNHQFEGATMEQQDAQELLHALLGCVIHDAELDTADSSFATAFDFDHVNAATTTQTHDVLSLSDIMDEITATTVSEQTHSRIHPGVSKKMENGQSSPQALSTSQQAQSPSIVHSHPDEKKQEDGDIAFPVTHAEEDLESIPVSQSVVFHEDQIQLNSAKSRLAASSAETATRPHETVPPTHDQTLPRQEQQQVLSTPLRIMQNAISSITPSPMSGWLGSTLQCCQCGHVRPIQNAPFLDIPLVPLSVSTYLATGSTDKATGCTLQQCLQEFTTVEHVTDVECRSCTIQKQTNHLQEEVLLLRGAMATLTKKTKDPDAIRYLQNDLQRMEQKLYAVRQIDPDGDDVIDGHDGNGDGDDDAAALDDMLLLGDEADADTIPTSACNGTTHRKKGRLERHVAKKCLLFTRRPSILCCHIQRRYFDPYTSRMEKCMEYVQFPQMLDIGPYCAYSGNASRPDTSWVGGCNVAAASAKKGASGLIYRLQSVIEHRGNAFGGHYVAYRRDDRDNWFRISDATVLPSSWEDVRRCQAYMLFYEAL